VELSHQKNHIWNHHISTRCLHLCQGFTNRTSRPTCAYLFYFILFILFYFLTLGLIQVRFHFNDTIVVSAGRYDIHHCCSVITHPVVRYLWAKSAQNYHRVIRTRRICLVAICKSSDLMTSCGWRIHTFSASSSSPHSSPS